MKAQVPSLARTMRLMVDPAYGIATRFIELGSNPLAPDVFVAYAEGGAASYLTDLTSVNWHNSSTASGASYEREQACWATLGELAERYCASIYDRKTFHRSKGEMLAPTALPVEQMILFSKEQYADPGFPFKPYDPEGELDWVEGVDLRSGDKIYAPVQLIYLSYEWADHMLMQTVSTGLACHTDKKKAHLSALLELIERDGFASAWLLGMPLPRLTLSQTDLAQLSEKAKQALELGDLEINLYALPNAFGVANIVATAVHQQYGFGLVGATAGLCPYIAIEKAILEALHGWIGFSQAMTGRTPLTLGEIETPHDHARYYMKETAWLKLRWFLTGGKDVSLADLHLDTDLTSAEELAEKLGQNGLGAYCFDLTTEDIACLGLTAFRALVPGLQPLSFGKTPVSEDRRRLQTMSNFWGWPMPRSLTTQPHPFP